MAPRRRWQRQLLACFQFVTARRTSGEPAGARESAPGRCRHACSTPQQVLPRLGARALLALLLTLRVRPTCPSSSSALLALLLQQLALVELQLLALQDVAVAAAALPRPRRNARVQPPARELRVQRLRPPGARSARPARTAVCRRVWQCRCTDSAARSRSRSQHGARAAPARLQAAPRCRRRAAQAVRAMATGVETRTLQIAGNDSRKRVKRRRQCMQRHTARQAAARAAGRASSSVRVWLRIFSLRFRCCDCFAGPASFSACARAARAPRRWHSHEPWLAPGPVQTAPEQQPPKARDWLPLTQGLPQPLRAAKYGAARGDTGGLAPRRPPQASPRRPWPPQRPRWPRRSASSRPPPSRSAAGRTA